LQKKGAQFLSGLLDENGLKEGVEYVGELIDRVLELYEGMDDSLKFKVDAKRSVEEKEKIKETPKGNGVDVVMDLKGVKCPINYVKAKIRIEQMEKGQTLELYLDDGEPINNVPTSLRNDGQNVLDIQKVDDEHYKVLVRKEV
jgi:sulfite reductase (ferredoxin)